MTRKRSFVALVTLGMTALYVWITYWQMGNGNYGWFIFDVVFTLIFLVSFIVSIKPLWRKEEK